MIDSKRKAIIFLTVAFLLAIVTAGVILVQISQAQERLGETVKVASAAKDFSSYREVKISDIEWVELPKTSAFESFITDEKDLEETIAVVNFKKGDLLTKNLVRKRLDIPPDNRVVWLNATTNVLIDQQVTEGDLVDLIVSYTENKQMKTERILTNVPVVQVEEVKDAEKDQSPFQIKISLNVEDAGQLIYYQNTATQIRALRVNQTAEGAVEVSAEQEAADKQAAVEQAKKEAEEKAKAEQAKKEVEEKAKAEPKK